MGKVLASLHGQRQIPAAALFMYVPARDHLCRGNATRAPLLEPRGHFQAPAMLTPCDFARGNGTCVLAGATADSSGRPLIFICAFISGIYVNLCAFIFQYSACTSRRFHASKMLIPRGVARGEGTCVFAGRNADSSCGSLRVRACACAISFVPWKCNSSPTA